MRHARVLQQQLCMCWYDDRQDRKGPTSVFHGSFEIKNSLVYREACFSSSEGDMGFGFDLHEQDRQQFDDRHSKWEQCHYVDLGQAPFLWEAYSNETLDLTGNPLLTSSRGRWGKEREGTGLEDEHGMCSNGHSPPA
ncbi:unnamed protein product [Brugia pahangi]|uniref:MHC_I-like_Ag-recog domain-containing protein n=1 Tax=Brugia pahangi TaxID=6280 RepID=A0A0N4TN98_BRUPA|nr:unnamed protein product [Brugia pahangi]